MRALTEVTDDDRAVSALAVWVIGYCIQFGVFVILLVNGLPWWVALWGSYSAAHFLMAFVEPLNPFRVAPVSRETGRHG